jgi:hypothetical protein
MAMLKERKVKEFQNKLQQLQHREEGKVKDHVKDGEMRLKMI